MNHIIKDLVLSLKENHQSMIDTLHQFCEINSGSNNLKGLAQMHEVLRKAFVPIADHIESRPLPAVETINLSGDKVLLECGNALLIRKRPELKRRLLLSGHMDTVYSPDHPFQQLTYLNDNHLNGPGVADMKGGLIVILHALNAFEELGVAKYLGWDVVINSDEEIGSPASSALLHEMAPNYQAALVYEPAMTPSTGLLAKNRRGSAKLTLVATGKAAHAGRAFKEGRNAICYLAEAVTAIHALNEKREGVTLNVGQIAGGQALNVVPEKAVAKVDIRISHPNDESWVRQEIDKMLQILKREDYGLAAHLHFGRPVKQVTPGTERLFKRIQEAGHQLGIAIDWQDSGGCCDGNNLAAQGLAVIDTLGVRGGNIHSPDEYILLDSLVERAALSALLLHDLARGGLEDLGK